MMAGFDATKISGHSFHQGAASSAAAASFNDYEIQQLGRWHSDSYKLYMDISQHRLLSLSSHLTGSFYMVSFSSLHLSTSHHFWLEHDTLGM